jgi:DNA-binding IclR family transcriptional regulator
MWDRVAVVGGERSAGDVAVLHRMSAVLDAFSTANPERTVSDVAAATGLPTSTAHRLLATLTTIGVLERPARGRYRLGIRLHELGQTAVFGIELRERALPFLEALRADVGHTIQLSIASGADVVYIHRLEDPTTFTRFVRSGQRVPIYASSSGKVLAAFGDTRTVMIAVQRVGFERRAPRTITSMRRFREEVAAVRSRGYAESVEETWPNMASVAVPVVDATGVAVAAISVAGSIDRFASEARERAARRALLVAARLSAALTGRRDVSRRDG